jgi:hypothetical protein
MVDIKKSLFDRLARLKRQYADGVIPGKIDSIELQNLRGQIRELKFILKLIWPEEFKDTKK